MDASLLESTVESVGFIMTLVSGTIYTYSAFVQSARSL
jgi:hypothetical protein